MYQNELGKTCFQHDMAYGDFEDLPRAAASNKVLRDKAFSIAICCYIVPLLLYIQNIVVIKEFLLQCS